MRLVHSLRRLVRGVHKRLSPRGAILMYHCVSHADLDPWALRVTPHNFAEHLAVMHEFGTPMSLVDFAAAHRRSQLPRHALAVTFDDGYANNLEQAKPLLEQYQVPATVFVASGYLTRDREFWWDELAQLLLTPGTLPEHLSLPVGEQTHQWSLQSAREYSQANYAQDCHRTLPTPIPGSRLAFYHTLWEVLAPLPDATRLTALDQLWHWADRSPTLRSTHRAMRPDELPRLEASGWIAVGAHTVTHPLLSAHSLAIQHQEIQQSKADLEAILEHPVPSFAYPFGNYHPETVPLVTQAGFTQACSTLEDTAWSGYDPWQLPRFEVQNWSGAEFARRLERWFR